MGGLLRRPVGNLLRRPLFLLLLAPALVYWQIETPLNDLASLAGDPSVNASYSRPLLAELEHRAHGAPLRVEIPMTGAHREAAFLPGQGPILLARGWERQLDTRDAALFYEDASPPLTAAAYKAWLREKTGSPMSRSRTCGWTSPAPPRAA